MTQNTWQLVDLNTTLAQPWRNGGGTTQALLAWPSHENWRIRCSVATVAADGPFSIFEGVQRWFAVLEGEGVDLNIAGTQHTQTQLSPPLCFDGGASTDCRLIRGETRDFNWMLNDCKGRMQAISCAFTHHAKIGQWLALYSHSHETILATQGQSLYVPPQRLAWLLCGAACDITVTTENALWMQAKI
jgi:environmental stress-induced protein Ves